MEKLIFDYSKKGNSGVSITNLKNIKSANEILPKELLRESELKLPEVSEQETVRHYTNLSSLNHHVDKDMYPLGSCTMKYNPKINDKLSAIPGFSEIHPKQPKSTVQGALQLMYDLEKYLCAITGMYAATLEPAAGSHGELVGVLIMKKYHESKGEKRKYILIPDSAHGTNPSSAFSAGYKTLQVKSNEKGCIDLDDLKEKMTPEVAGIMLTNPNTLGVFEEEVENIVNIVHEYDGVVYMDGANLNALLGIVRPGDMGFDITHMNLHKTFSTPHGGGGPGSGPIAVAEKFAKYLPAPVVEKNGNEYAFKSTTDDSIGRVLGNYSNFSILVRAYVYITMLGLKGLEAVSRNAILNSNYLKDNLIKTFEIPFSRNCMHEFVASGENFKKFGIRTLDIAKRLLDYGIHAPTVYFPLIVKEALMIEPTETENIESLDKFIETMEKIAEEAQENPDILHNAPVNTPVRRLNELKANKEMNIRWIKEENEN